MRYGVFVLMLIALPCCGQTPGTGKAETRGPCSPAVSGSNNQFTMNCKIDEQQGQKMLDILNKILANELDPDAVMAKLDEILKAINKENEARAPRGLNTEQEGRIVSKLSALKGYQADFGVTNQTWEQVTFMRELESVLKRAQLSIFENQAEASGPSGAVTKGVLVRPFQDTRSFDAAFLIRNALLAENIAAHISTGIPDPESGRPKDDPSVYRVLIIVGDKP